MDKTSKTFKKGTTTQSYIIPYFFCAKRPKGIQQKNFHTRDSIFPDQKAHDCSAEGLSHSQCRGIDDDKLLGIFWYLFSSPCLQNPVGVPSDKIPR
jgi:hypothetical protein